MDGWMDGWIDGWMKNGGGWLFESMTGHEKSMKIFQTSSANTVNDMIDVDVLVKK